ncbi:hypothetical protein A3195_01350 [Candidatus Thiodiazotropha endoloripes]|nr:hypothetical protein A3193_00705 [Candidatus Thiodiazotropha endoloripes]ODB90177.1 hypothetical protein A3195_01350 [Candidatus Thiodiazotropha endoloripes]
MYLLNAETLPHVSIVQAMYAIAMGRKIGNAQSITVNVRWLDVASQTVRLQGPIPVTDSPEENM